MSPHYFLPQGTCMLMEHKHLASGHVLTELSLLWMVESVQLMKEVGKDC